MPSPAVGEELAGGRSVRGTGGRSARLLRRSGFPWIGSLPVDSFGNVAIGQWAEGH